MHSGKDCQVAQMFGDKKLLIIFYVFIRQHNVYYHISFAENILFNYSPLNLDLKYYPGLATLVQISAASVGGSMQLRYQLETDPSLINTFCPRKQWCGSGSDPHHFGHSDPGSKKSAKIIGNPSLLNLTFCTLLFTEVPFLEAVMWIRIRSALFCPPGSG